MRAEGVYSSSRATRLMASSGVRWRNTLKGETRLTKRKVLAAHTQAGHSAHLSLIFFPQVNNEMLKCDLRMAEQLGKFRFQKISVNTVPKDLHNTIRRKQVDSFQGQTVSVNCG